MNCLYVVAARKSPLAPPVSAFRLSRDTLVGLGNLRLLSCRLLLADWCLVFAYQRTRCCCFASCNSNCTCICNTNTWKSVHLNSFASLSCAEALAAALVRLDCACKSFSLQLLRCSNSATSVWSANALLLLPAMPALAICWLRFAAAAAAATAAVAAAVAASAAHCAAASLALAAQGSGASSLLTPAQYHYHRN